MTEPPIWYQNTDRQHLYQANYTQSTRLILRSIHVRVYNLQLMTKILFQLQIIGYLVYKYNNVVRILNIPPCFRIWEYVI